jgi:hypothetical protein
VAVARIWTSELNIAVADNEPFDGHRAGYHGLVMLKHRSREESLFVPSFCGTWFEFVVDGQHLEDEWYLEPSRAVCRLSALSSRSVSLYWPELPMWGVEAVVVYEAVEPHYIDLRLSFTAKRPVAKTPFLGFFFASYINHPEDPAIYFYGEDRASGVGGITRACSPRHGVESTFRYAGANIKPPFSKAIDPKWMYASFSKIVFTEPFFFGYWRDLVYAAMFASKERVWFTHSPTGGGQGCPAWDFLLFVPNHNPNTTYEFQARLMLCARTEAHEVRRRYEQWKGSLGH